MSSLETPLAPPWPGATRGFGRHDTFGRLGRLMAALHETFAANPRRLLELNDRLLRDIDVARADLEHDAQLWPFCRPRPARRATRGIDFPADA
jgi:hypothetical protein